MTKRVAAIPGVATLARIRAILRAVGLRLSSRGGSGSAGSDVVTGGSGTIGPVTVTSDWEGGDLFTYNDITDAPYSAVGDGTTDAQPAINSAISAAVSGAKGGIYVPAGTFLCSKQNVAGTVPTGSLSSFDLREVTDFTIQGEGPRSVLKMDPSNLSAGDWYLFRIRNNCERIWFKNLTLDGSFAVGTSPAGIDEQTHLVNLGSGTAAANNDGVVNDIIFENVFFKNCRGDGVRALGAAGSEVNRMRFVNCTFDGTHRSGIGIQRQVHDTQVIGCSFRNITDTHIDHEPTGTGENGPFLVSGCLFDHRYNPGTIALTLTGGGVNERNERAVVVGNTFIDGTINAINIRGVDFSHNQVIVSSLQFADAVIYFFRGVDDVNICDNVIERTSGTAGRVINIAQNLATSPNGIRITGNVIRQGTDAACIGVENGNEIDIKDNVVHYLSSSTGAASGIVVAPSISNVSGIRIAGNTVRGADGGGSLTSGIKIGGGGYTTSAVEIRDNDLSGCTSDLEFGGTISGYPRVSNNRAATYSGHISYAVVMHTGGNSAVPDLEGWADPEGVVTAPVGSTFRQLNVTSGTVKWHKESGSGNTGWVAK